MTRLASVAATQFYFAPGQGSNPDPEYSGSTMVFVQPVAPVGWIKNIDYDDYALRVVSGTPTTGGTRAFTSTFTTYTFPSDSRAFNISATFSPATISTTQMATHYHTATGLTNTSHTTFSTNPAVGTKTVTGGYGPYSSGLSSAGSGGGHTHAADADTITYPGATTATNINVKYVDSILATKS